MNSIFPRPFEGELIWSAVARYKRRNRRTFKAVLNDLGMLANRRFEMLAPQRLRQLAAGLPFEMGLSAECILRRHTLFNYILATSPDEFAEGCMEFLLGSANSGHRLRIRALLRMRADTCARYCPECREDDLAEYGESAWRSMHQLPAVNFCSKHATRLVTSKVPFSGESLTALDDVPHSASQERASERELRFAQQSALLLQEDVPCQNMEAVTASIIRRAFGDRALGKPVKAVTEIVERALKLLGEDEPASAAPCPVARQLLNGRPNVPPMLWVAAAVIADADISKLLAEGRKTPPRESGPWPCLNAECTDFERPLIRTAPKFGGEMIFKCPSCQFSYARALPLVRDPSLVHGFAFRAIRSSDEWMDTIRKLWTKAGMTWSDLSLKLGKTKAEIGRAALEAGCEDTPNLSLKSFRIKRDGRQLRLDARRAAHRDRWMRLLARWPDLTLEEKYGEVRDARAALRKSDPVWLDAHKPPTRDALRVRSVGWIQRDRQYVEFLETRRAEVVALSPNSRRSARMIATWLKGKLALRGLILAKLPGTKEALFRYAETDADFVARKVAEGAGMEVDPSTSGFELDDFLTQIGLKWVYLRSERKRTLIASAIKTHPSLSYLIPLMARFERTRTGLRSSRSLYGKPRTQRSRQGDNESEARLLGTEREDPQSG